MKVFVIKDKEGVLRPMAGIWSAEGRMREASLAEWGANLKDKKHYRDCTLVEAELTELA